MNNKQAIDILGMETCKPFILNALKEATEVCRNSKKEMNIYENLFGELEDNWFGLMVLVGWHRKVEERYLWAIKQIKELSFFLDKSDGIIGESSIDIEILKEQILMTDLVSRYGVKLMRAGSHFKAKCPHHEERTASYHVFKDHSHCFGCGVHHDIISFVQEMENCDFKEALKILNKSI